MKGPGKFFLALSVLLLMAAWMVTTFFDRATDEGKAQKVMAANLHDLEKEMNLSLQEIIRMEKPEQFHEFFIHHGQQKLGFSFFYFVRRSNSEGGSSVLDTGVEDQSRW